MGLELVLFGRKINMAEDPLEIIRIMRMVADGVVEPSEAVRVYHDALAKIGKAPARSISDDSEITDEALR